MSKMMDMNNKNKEPLVILKVQNKKLIYFFSFSKSLKIHLNHNRSVFQFFQFLHHIIIHEKLNFYYIILKILRYILILFSTQNMVLDIIPPKVLCY